MAEKSNGKKKPTARKSVKVAKPAAAQKPAGASKPADAPKPAAAPAPASTSKPSASPTPRKAAKIAPKPKPKPAIAAKPKSEKAPKETVAKAKTAKEKKRSKAKDKPRASKGKIAVRVILIVIVLSLATFVAAVSWDRWFRYDDSADIQGEWIVSGKSATTVIDGETIRLTNDVSYEYSLDTWDKTIAFTFSKLNGLGTYWFSDDRQQLVIDEEGTTDIVRDVLRRLGIDTADPADGLDPESSLVLVKVKGPAGSDPQDLTNNSTSEADAAGDMIDASAEGNGSADAGEAGEGEAGAGAEAGQ